MLFVSLDFIEFFLPLLLILYYAAFRLFLSLNIIVLLIASIVFCLYNGFNQGVLLLVSISVNFIIAKEIQANINFEFKQKLYLIFGVLLNILCLSYFKYSNFIIENASALLSLTYSKYDIRLPLGISFYTFTQIAFLIDVSRGHGPKILNFSTYALFVTYFPHVIAGPIIHWKEMFPQFLSLSKVKKNIVADVELQNLFFKGAGLFSIGVLKKIIMADQLSEYVSIGFEHVKNLTFTEAWFTSLSYTFQLYFDFSGYCDMAIGISFMLGIALPINFNSPYKATSIKEFWRCWHITLSTWLRDYVYIPLGGNRGGRIRTLRNLFLTFIIGGVWHGASWTFIVWGALHGIACCIQELWAEYKMPMSKAFAFTITFLFINFSWVFFRASDLTTAFCLLKKMIEPAYPARINSISQISLLLISACVVWLLPNSQSISDKFPLASSKYTGIFLGIAIFITIVSQNSAPTSPFLYFNF
jgi:alginate O-acetyltransferase complex protein AlgI